MPSFRSLPVALWCAATLVTGCRNMLGLDGLSYDKASESTPDVGSGGLSAWGDDYTDSSDADLDGSGGHVDPGGPAQVIDVGQDAIVFASLSDQATFHVYHADSGEVVSYLAADPKPIETLMTWAPGWTHVVERPTPPTSALLGYKDGEYQLVDDWLSARSALSATTEPGSTGWTQIVSYTRDGQGGLLSYDGTEGDYRVGEADTTIGQWEPGFTQIVSCNRGDAPEFLKYDAATGRIELQRFNETGDDLELVAKGTWSPARVLACVGPVSAPRLVVYGGSLGGVDVVEIALNEAEAGQLQTLSFAVKDHGAWPEDYSTLTPVLVDGHTGIVGYNQITGKIGLLGLDPLADGAQVVK